MRWAQMHSMMHHHTFSINTQESIDVVGRALVGRGALTFERWQTMQTVQSLLD